MIDMKTAERKNSSEWLCS